VHVEFLLGTAWSLPTPLVIRLPGRPPLRIRAHYATRPWSDAPYYAYRAGAGASANSGGEGGSVVVPNVAVHALAGLGVRRLGR